MRAGAGRLRLGMGIDWTIKVSDVLTSVTIIVSVVALLLSLGKDRDAKAAERANQVRGVAAAAISKLDRWQALKLSLFQEMQPTFIELSESLADKYDVQSVRDQFWKRVNLVRTNIAQKVLDEQLGTAYADLLSHFPAARSKFTGAFAKLSDVESAVMDNYLAESEQAILSLEGQKKTYLTPVLGNALRRVATEEHNKLRAETESAIAPVRDYLFNVISLSDEQILDLSRVFPKTQ
jgi:hypothetical protein